MTPPLASQPVEIHDSVRPPAEGLRGWRGLHQNMQSLIDRGCDQLIVLGTFAQFRERMVHKNYVLKAVETEHARWSKLLDLSRPREKQGAPGEPEDLMIGPGGHSGRRRWSFVLAGRATFSTASCSSGSLADIGCDARGYNQAGFRTASF
jgi:hypothetical protein